VTTPVMTDEPKKTLTNLFCPIYYSTKYTRTVIDMLMIILKTCALLV